MGVNFSCDINCSTGILIGAGIHSPLKQSTSVLRSYSPNRTLELNEKKYFTKMPHLFHPINVQNPIKSFY